MEVFLPVLTLELLLAPDAIQVVMEVDRISFSLTLICGAITPPMFCARAASGDGALSVIAATSATSLRFKWLVISSRNPVRSS